MKSILFALCVFSFSIGYTQKHEMELWYKGPAKKWTEALPIGNGRFGGMVFGDYNRENIQLNEESVWAGSKLNNNNPQAKSHLKEIQQALFRGEYKKAEQWSNQYMVGTPPNIRSYQPLGNLFIQHHWKGLPSAYKRSLNLHTGIAQTAYTIDGNSVEEEVFVSAPGDIMIITIKAEKAIDAEIFLSREFDNSNEVKEKKRKILNSIPLYSNRYKNEKGLAWYTGQILDEASPNRGPGGKHMRYAAAMKIIANDGYSTASTSDTSVGFQIKSAKRIVIILTGATDYNVEKLDVVNRIDPFLICKKLISTASGYTLATLQQIHVRDHRSFFDRVSFSLGEDEYSHLATDERLTRMRDGNTDNGLLALYYQYGRYLLMGSSRKPVRLPANLQGIWNDLYDAPWNADFHTNINLQMNYWPAESGNLAETAIPLSNFVSKLMVPGAVTAQEMYGARGWTMHHLTDPFGRTGVMDGVWGITNMDGPWMTFPVWDHFEFTQDTVFLRKVAYPMMKGAVQFVLDYLIKSPEGYLVTNPSHSPENSFFVPNTDKKEKSQMTYAPTVDIHIINALFNNFLNAATLLKKDQDMVITVQDAQKQLPPLKVAANGTIQEWIQDFEEVEPGHRHISHLLGLYPLDLISPKDPLFFAAAAKTLERRLSSGGGHTGWSKAWIVGLYARLLQPEKAVDNLNDLIRKSTLDNLFDTHPPFQIDGNFGGAAAIAEMLLQSQHGEIHILPALPDQWNDGSIYGLRGRGACTVNMEWKEGRLITGSIHSDRGGTYQMRYQTIVKQIKVKAGQNIKFDGSLMPILSRN